MKLEMTRGCINDWLGIDNKLEIDMTEEERESYFKRIVTALPSIEEWWFNRFLAWFLEEYGEYECSDKPCECCGDYTETWTLEINENGSNNSTDIHRVDTSNQFNRSKS